MGWGAADAEMKGGGGKEGRDRRDRAEREGGHMEIIIIIKIIIIYFP